MTTSKSSNVTVYRCECGHSIITKIVLSDVWCLPCGRRMRRVRRDPPGAPPDNESSHNTGRR